MNTYRTAVIGLGNIGFLYGFDRKREQPASHSQAFDANRSIRLVAGCDPNEERLRRWGDYFPEAQTFSSVDELPTRADYDIIVVATDEDQHLPVMRKIVERTPRLIVLEKPVAPNLAPALLIRETADKAGVPVMVNHERRFSKDYFYAENIVAERRFGKIVTVQAVLYSGQFAVLPRDDERAQGALIHDGTHLIDIIRYVTNETPAFYDAKRIGTLPDGSARGITAHALIGKDVPLTVHCGYATDHFTFELDVMLERGRIRIGNGLLEIWESVESPYYEKMKSLIQQKNPDGIYPTGYFSNMVQSCVDFLDGKAPLRSSLDDGIEAMRLIREILTVGR